MSISTCAIAGNSSLPQLIVPSLKSDSKKRKLDAPSAVIPRARFIAIDTTVLEKAKKQLDAAPNGPFPQIEIRAFDDVVIVIEVRSTAADSKDANYWSFSGALISPDPRKNGISQQGYFGIGLNKGVMSGSFYIGGLTYEIRYSEENGYRVQIFDTSKVPGGAPVSVSTGSGEQSTNNDVVAVKNGAADVASPVIVDLLVAYKTAAKKSANGEQNIRANINRAIGFANHAYAESNVNLRLRLVYAGETAYVGSGNLLQDLAAFQNPTTAGFADVRRWRDQFAADVVSLWTEYVPTIK